MSRPAACVPELCRTLSETIRNTYKLADQGAGVDPNDAHSQAIIAEKRAQLDERVGALVVVACDLCPLPQAARDAGIKRNKK